MKSLCRLELHLSPWEIFSGTIIPLYAAPAIIDPGDNTTTEVPEGGIRYFQVQCDSFSNMVLVELYDNTGTSFLYCSATEANPGPLTSNTAVNNTVGITVRTCVVSLANTNSRVKFQYLIAQCYKYVLFVYIGFVHWGPRCG